MELGSHTELDCPLLQVSTAGSLDTVFVTLFRAAVERACCGVHKLLRTGEVPTTLTSIVLVVADGLSRVCWSELLQMLLLVHTDHTEDY